MKRLIYVIALSAIAVLVFAAIAAAQNDPASQENTTNVQNSTTEPAEAPAETTVEIRNNAFNPPQLNVAPGTTVTFVNRDTVPHTATADNKLFDSGELAPGSSFPVVLEGTGTVTYHCEQHPEMQGSIVVGEPGQASAPTEGGGTGTTTTTPPNQAVSVYP